MVSIDDAVIARLDKKNHHVEILVDPYGAADMIDGKEVRILDIMAIDTIFKDVKKGDKASDEILMEIFGSTDTAAIGTEIVLKGEVHLTTQQRKEMLEAKKKKIIDQLARSAMDPQTKAPHPRKRIELAMEEANVHVDPFKKVSRQVKDVVDQLRPVLPISMEKIKIELKVPSKHIGKAYGEIRTIGRLMREEWLNDGSWTGTIELPPGMQTELYNRLNVITKGSIETKIID
jgi:ribosome maturation protein SDO1